MWPTVDELEEPCPTHLERINELEGQLDPEKNTRKIF